MHYPTLPPDQEQQRLAALRRFDLLDTLPEAAFDRLAALAARLFQVPLALITLIDRDRQWFKTCQGPASAGLSLTETPRDIAFCAHTILSREVLVAEDTRLDPRFLDNPFVCGEPHVRFYAGAPLLTADGQAVGSLCLLGFEPREFPLALRESLRDLAASVVSEMELRCASAHLTESERVYRQMFENSPQPMWVYDSQTLRFLAVNDTAIATYGHSREEFLSRTICDIRPPEDADAVRKTALAAGKGTRTTGLWRHCKKDGATIWVDIATHPCQFEGGAARLAVVSDVTERQTAAEALRRSEARKSGIVETALDCILSVDQAQRIIEWNPAAERTFGYSRAEALGQAAGELIFPPALRETHRQGVAHYLATGEAHWLNTRVEVTAMRKDGSEFPAELSVTAIEGGAEPIFTAYLRDITERRQAEEALRESEERFRTIAQASPVAITATRYCDGTILYANDQFYAIFGLDPSVPVAGLDATRFYDDPAARAKLLTALGENQCLHDYQARLKNVNGESFWVSGSFQRVNFHGEDALFAAYSDITQSRQLAETLRASESRLRTVVTNLPVIVWAINADGIFTFSEGKGLDALGLKPGEVVGQSVFEVYGGNETLKQRVQATLRGETSTWRDDIQGMAFETHITPLRDAAGGVAGAIGVSQDVTERRQAETLLGESRERYQSLVEHHPYAVCSIGLDGRFLTVNAAFEKLTGYADAEVGGQPFGPMVAPECLAASHWHYTQTLQGWSQTHELTILHRNGGRVDTSITTVPIFIAGAITGIYAVIEDITPRKSLEAEREELLAQTESLLADALERADHDPLTGLLNHRAFHKRLEEEAARAERDARPLALLLLDLDNFKFFNDAYGHLVGDDVLRQVAQALSSCGGAGDTLARFGGDEFALLMPGASRADAQRLAGEMREAISQLGYAPPGYAVPIPLTLSVGGACLSDDGPSRLDMLEAADARLRVAKSGGEDAGQALRLRQDMTGSLQGFSMLDALVTAVDNKDRYTRKHSEDVLTYSVQIACALGLDPKTLRVVEIAALLHDVGKIGVPDQILRKPGALSDEEFAAIKQHPMMGAIIVGAVPGFEETLDAVRHHHERWDGLGYPGGLCGEETPLLARLMAVADAYSAMTTDRPYRKGMEAAKARRILEEGAGTQWDPACVAAFLRARPAA